MNQNEMAASGKINRDDAILGRDADKKPATTVNDDSFQLHIILRSSKQQCTSFSRRYLSRDSSEKGPTRGHHKATH